MSSNPQSVNGSESEFEFIETPKAPTPTFEKFEPCGVRTTAVSQHTAPKACPLDSIKNFQSRETGQLSLTNRSA
jgi:hypothetical protein